MLVTLLADWPDWIYFQLVLPLFLVLQKWGFFITCTWLVLNHFLVAVSIQILIVSCISDGLTVVSTLIYYFHDTSKSDGIFKVLHLL